MRAALLDILRCPACQAEGLQAVATGRDQREIREGLLLCGQCGSRYPIQDGIVDLLHQPSPAILQEQAGWVQLYSTAEAERDEIALRLPYHDDPHWRMHAANFAGLLDRVELGGARVLDLGCGSAWSSRLLLSRGAAEVIAIDILRQCYIGLGTADLYFAHGERYFERVLCDMQRLPFVGACFDFVLSAAALHHADSLDRAVAEARRVLRPGGQLLVVNEPVLAARAESPLAESAEVAHGVNEHIYSVDEWLAACERNGMRMQLLVPRWLEQASADGRLSKTLEVHMPDNYLPELFRTASGRRRLTTQPVLYNLYRDYGLPLAALAWRSRQAARPGIRLQAALLRALRPVRPPGRKLSFGRVLGQHLIRGFYPPEQTDDGRPYVWSEPEAEVAVGRPFGARMVRLSLILPPVPATLTISLDGAVAQELRVAGEGALGEPVELCLQLPRPRRRQLRVGLQVERGWSPQEIGYNADDRRLGVAVFALECSRS